MVQWIDIVLQIAGRIDTQNLMPLMTNWSNYRMVKLTSVIRIAKDGVDKNAARPQSTTKNNSSTSLWQWAAQNAWNWLGSSWLTGWLLCIGINTDCLSRFQNSDLICSSARLSNTKRPFSLLKPLITYKFPTHTIYGTVYNFKIALSGQAIGFDWGCAK